VSRRVGAHLHWSTNLFRPFLDNLVTLHAVLMAIAWGILVPLSIVIARHSKNDRHPMWFYLHRAMNVCWSLCLSLTMPAKALKPGVLFLTMPVLNAKTEITFASFSLDDKERKRKRGKKVRHITGRDLPELNAVV